MRLNYDAERIDAIVVPLEEDGCAIGDAIAAAQIVLAIEELDRVAHPLRPTRAVAKFMSLHDMVAGYDEDNDSYVVCAFQLAGRVRKAAADRSVWLGCPVSPVAFMAGASAHEVRHRLQWRVLELQLWDENHQLPVDPFGIHPYICNTQLPNVWSAKTPREAFKARREMDARIVELLAASCSRNLAVPADMADIVWSEP